ncbi:MAG: helix-turn-helix domain-containing protein [Nitrososphaerales archaeon]
MSSHQIEQGSPLSGQMVGKLVTLVEVPNQRLFGTKKAAKYLGIHEDTLRSYADLGWITPRRINNRRVFILEDLDTFIDSLPCYDDPGGKPGGKEINNGN